MRRRCNADRYVWRAGITGNRAGLLRNFFNVGFSYQILHIPRRRFALTLFYFQILCAPAAFPQRSFTSFGALTDCNLGYRATGVGLIPGGISPASIVVLAAEQPSLHLYELTSNGKLTHTQSVRTQHTYRFAEFSRGKDGSQNFIAITSDGNVLSVVNLTPKGAEEKDYKLPGIIDRFVIADINRDKRKDILLFGKNSAGIATLLGQANGALKFGRTLFPDVSFSDLSVADLNGDGIMDVVALDWLANQLSVFYQIGRLIFSEQVSVPLPGEPSIISISPISAEQTFRLALSFPELQQLQVYSGNSLGDYRLIATIACGKHPSGIAFTSLNTDEFPDVVTATDQGIEVALGASNTSFSQPTTFGTSTSIAAWNVVDLDDDGKKDCIILDKISSRLIALANSDVSGKIEWPSEYCVGIGPGGIVIADIDGGGKQDIGVVNSVSSTLSVLLNRGKGRFTGQQTLSLPEGPTTIRLVTGLPRKERTLVASHAAADRFSVITLADDISRSRMFSVPTGADPFVVVARRDTTGLQFVVRHQNPKDRTYMLSLFDQISQRQFVERSLRSTLPTKILALNVSVGVAPGTFDLLFATNDKASRQTTISQAVSDSGMQFRSVRPMFSYPDSSAGTRLIVGGFVNSDPFRDVIVSVGSPRNGLGIWYGKAPTALRDSIEWVYGVQPANDDAIIIRDVNNDDLPDITWLDTMRHSVLVMYGTERKGLRPPVAVLPAEKVQCIRLSNFREAGSTDVVLSNSDRGTISIIMNPFAR